jgi:hypothetical protein
MQQFTYLFGAGASANVLPVVNQMAHRMRFFVDYLKFVEHGYKTGNLEIRKIDTTGFSELLSKVSGVIHEIEQHSSIDTFAKKLYLHDPRSEDLKFLLDFLSVYFIFEQLYKPSAGGMSSFFAAMISEKQNDVKCTVRTLDHRYDSFFAALLSNKNGVLELAPNVNFLSWNYDFQVELAYMNFRRHYDLDSVQEELAVFPRGFTDIDISALNTKLLKLNGTAGLVSTNDSSNTYGGLFNFAKHSLNEESFDILLNVLRYSGREQFKNTVEFAWTNNRHTEKARQKATNIIANSSAIVCIGYSFPYFNRNVDKQIFSLFGQNSPGKTIYVQAPPNSVESIIQRLKGVLLRPQEFTIIPYTETDQFLIPNEMTLP